MSDVSTIFRVWQHQGSGYVSLPRKLRNDESPKGSKNHKGKWEERSFRWPEEIESIKEYIKSSNAERYDLYWCPTILNSKQRVKENIPELSILYADLDEVNPRDIQKELTPSVAWESSPGRYAAIWFLENSLPQDEGENLNKSLTYLLGADKGGWDLTQVLRIPGTRNFKYEGNPKGKLLWYNEEYVNPQTIPLLPTEQQALDFENTLIDSDPSRLLSLISSVKDKLKPKTLNLLIASEEDILLYDRSEKLWELECQLLESGVSPEKVLELVACSHWNKYRGRKDEMKRLQIEVDKALAHTGGSSTTQRQQRNFLEKRWTPYSELMGMKLDQPGWMIEGVWQRTSHGMIAGEPKTYKSVIATDMAVAVASGKPFLGKYPVHHQGPVMYIQEENSPWLVKDRIEKITNARGVLEGKVEQLSSKKFNVTMPPDLPLYFLNNMGFDLNSSEDREFLEKSIQEIKPVLIIFDPLYLMLGDRDENSSKDIRPILNWLLYLRYQYKTSVIIIHHWNKSGKSERGGQRMLGSVLFHGWVESALYTRVVDEQNHQIEVEREFRSFPKPANLGITFNFGEPGDNSYEAILQTEVKTSLNQVNNLLGEVRRTTAKELAASMGISAQKVKQRLDQLVKQGKATINGEIYTIKEET